MTRRHWTWTQLLRAWRGFPWPGGRGRDRAKHLLTARARSPRGVPTVAGWLLLENGADSLERHILATGTHWETQVVALLQRSRAQLQGATVVDVGGHVGFYAALLADLVGADGRVVAVEAHEELCARIGWARERNRRPWLEVVHGAAAAEPGTLTLRVDEDRGHTTAAGAADDTFSVAAIRLDDWLSDHAVAPPRLVLMDIEGGEAAALCGMEATLRAAQPDIVLEVHPDQLADLGTDQDDLIAWLGGLAPYDLFVVDHLRGVVPFDGAPQASSWHLLARRRTGSAVEL